MSCTSAGTKGVSEIINAAAHIEIEFSSAHYRMVEKLESTVFKMEIRFKCQMQTEKGKISQEIIIDVRQRSSSHQLLLSFSDPLLCLYHATRKIESKNLEEEQAGDPLIQCSRQEQI